MHARPGAELRLGAQSGSRSWARACRAQSCTGDGKENGMRQTHRIDLGKRMRRGILIALVVDGLMFWNLLVLEGKPIPFFLATGLVMVLLSMMASFIAYWRHELILDDGGITYRRTFSTISIPYTDIFQLTFFRTLGLSRLSGFSDHLMGVYTIETSDGAAFSFPVARSGDARNLDWKAVIEALAERTGLSWVGIDSRSGAAPTFWSFLREASGLTRKHETLAWLVGSCVKPRPEMAGLAGSSLRWATLLFASSSFAIFALVAAPQVLIEPSDYVTVGKFTTLGWKVSLSLMLLGLLAWTMAALGANIILAHVRLQRRGRQSLEVQITAAREVQQRLIPKILPTFLGVSLAAVCLPAQDVGGDCFDVVRLTQGRFAVSVADVSGKGLGACLMMTMMKGSFSSALRASDDMSRALAIANEEIRNASVEKMFVTMAAAVVDAEKGMVTVARAGHNPPLVVRAADGAIEWFTPSGLALGLVPTVRFERHQSKVDVPIDEGDVLVLYSDGVTEAMNGAREEFGAERFAEIVVRDRKQTPDEIVASLLDEIGRFRSGARVNDDLTLAIVKITGRGAEPGA